MDEQIDDGLLSDDWPEDVAMEQDDLSLSVLEDDDQTELAQQASPTRHAASEVGSSLASGFSAMFAVRRAARERADAVAELRQIRHELEVDQEDLAHREDVECRFEEIVETQSRVVQEETSRAEEAKDEARAQQTRVAALKNDLQALREANERELRPYRNLMESSRGRSDDAARSLANVRRAVRNAEANLNNATKRRAQRIGDAHRAVDNAKERLSSVQMEFERLQAEAAHGSGALDDGALERVQNELVSEQSNLAAKNAEVEQTTQDAQAAVDKAQQELWSLQRELQGAERTAAAAKQEATTHKDEYDTRYKAAQAKERAVEESIRATETRLQELRKVTDDALARVDEAQDILAEAYDIHEHPEASEELRQRIDEGKADLAAARAEVDELTASERELRRSTRVGRIAVVVVIVLLVALIALLVWFLVFRQ